MAKNIWEVFDANPGAASGKQVTDAQGNVTTNPTMIGHKAVSAALAQGYSVSDIEAALGSDLGKSRTAASNKGGSGLSADLKIKGPTSVWGTHSDKVDPITGKVTQTAEEGRHQYIGDADINFMRQQGVSDQDIMEHWQEHGLKNPDAGVDLEESFRNVKLGADVAAQDKRLTDLGGKYSALEGDYRNLSGQYSMLQNKYDAMGTQYTDLQADVAQAAKDALKIKYTGSTAVRNPSAMGIQAAQGTPFRGSGLAGTAALARPNKGLKIKTLNV